MTEVTNVEDKGATMSIATEPCFNTPAQSVCGPQSVLSELALLEPNWDGYGASPMATAALEKARSLWLRLSVTLPQPDVVPNPNGTVSFEWESDKGWANIEIGKMTFAVYVAPKNVMPISHTHCVLDDERCLLKIIEAIQRVV